MSAFENRPNTALLVVDVQNSVVANAYRHRAQRGAFPDQRHENVRMFFFDGDRITNERVYLDLVSLLTQIGRTDLLPR